MPTPPWDAPTPSTTMLSFFPATAAGLQRTATRSGWRRCRVRRWLFRTLGCSFNLRWWGLITNENSKVISHCYINYVHITREKRNPSAKKTCQWPPGSWLFLKYICVSFETKNYTCLHHLHVFGCFQLHMCFFLGVSNRFSHHRHHVKRASERSKIGASNSQPSGKGLKVVPATFPSHQVTKWSSEQSHRIQYNWDWNYLPTFSCLILLVHACKGGQIYQSHRIL